MAFQTLCAFLIAKEEGFFTAGTLPARRHNPGDLRHSPHSSHQGIGANDIGAIDDDEDGEADLERQLVIDAGRGFNMNAAVYSWAPPTENNSAKYLSDLIAGFAEYGHPEIGTTTPLSEALLIGPPKSSV